MSEQRLQSQISHHWDHVRHIDKIRYSSTSVSSGVLIGLITASTRFNSWTIYLLLIAIFVSTASIVTHLKLGLEYYLWASHAISLEKKLGVRDFSAKPSGLYGDEKSPSAAFSSTSLFSIDALRPSGVATTEILSPAHWQMALQIFGFSVASSWLIAILTNRSLGTYAIGIIFLIISSILSYAVYMYGHLKIEQIDEEIHDTFGNSEDSEI